MMLQTMIKQRLRLVLLICTFFPFVSCEEESSSPYSPPSNVMVGTETNWLTLCEEESVCGDGLTCLCGLCTKKCESMEACGDGEISQCLSISEDLRCEGSDAPVQSATVCWPRENHPEIEFEICNDQVDNDANLLIDCDDPQCSTNDFCLEGDDLSECSDQVDNDGDGQIDCEDTECANLDVCAPMDLVEDCSDGQDNEEEGQIE